MCSAVQTLNTSTPADNRPPPKLNETGISFGSCFANRLLCRPSTLLPGGSGQWLMLQRSHENAERTVVDVTETQDAAGRGKVAFAFLLRARADGRPVEMRGVDLLTITDGRISAVWAAAQPAS